MGVPPVDPAQPATRAMKLAVAFIRRPFGRWVGIHVSARIDPVLLKLSGGRVSTFPMAPIVALTVPGRRTGESRTTPLVYFTDEDEVVLIASSFGRERHPAWYHNVMAHPEVTLTVDGTDHRYVAREVAGPDRDRLYARAEKLYAGYADYEISAGAAGRTIPVIALRPAT
jgi:deazaflavin-dependent oxidoreductase (nitroreductase family)